MSKIPFLLASLSLAAFAGNAVPLLVDVNWLASHIDDRDLVVIHVGPKSGYTTGHIAGARLVSLEDVALPMNHKDPTELMLELPPAEELRAKLSALGISNDSRIVVYYALKSEFQSATRVIFTLDYIGLGDRASLLNGGIAAWKAADKPLTTVEPKITPGKLTAVPVKPVVADAELVKSVGKMPHHKLVDGRAAAYYKGVEATYEKQGHIPGAVNIPYSELLDANQMYDPAHAAKLFKDAGIEPGDTIVAYCHVGQQATTVVFTARLLGYPVKLYDGSFQDWAIHSRGPVEK